MAFTRKTYTLQRHKHILKCLRQDNGGSFTVKLAIGMVLGLLFLALTLSIHIPNALAYAHTPCAKSERGYVVVEGDMLSWIAFRYHMNWSALASHEHVVNPNLIYVDQIVCIPVQGFSTGTQAKQVRTVVMHMALVKVAHANPTTHTTPPVQVPPTATPVVQPPTSTPYAPPAGSISALIAQIFGSYGSGAINVARCESGLNPNASNPAGAAGLFQIMPGTWARTSQAGMSPYNAQANAIAAHELFVRDGYSWREWTCKP